jgi:hypothetical protein
MTLPIHNRVAEADLARDELQVKQSEIRLRQLQNQARLEVEDALIAMRRARSSYEAAVEARHLQQESLEAEQAKFEVGASTSFFVIQYESLLAQSKSTEVAALSSYVKAKAALHSCIIPIANGKLRLTLWANRRPSRSMSRARCARTVRAQRNSRSRRTPCAPHLRTSSGASPLCIAMSVTKRVRCAGT